MSRYDVLKNCRNLIRPDVSETDDVMPAWLDFAFNWPHAAMRTGLCLGVYNYPLGWFYFKLEGLSTVLTLQRPCSPVHDANTYENGDNVCQKRDNIPRGRRRPRCMFL
jgi:hypothetical protein